MKFEVVENITDWQALATGWQSLFERCAGPAQVFLEWHWVNGWWRHCGAKQGALLKTLVVSEDNRPILIWPWMQTRTAGLRMLEPLGGLLSCYDDALVDTEYDDDLLQRAWDHLLQSVRCDLIVLRGVHEDARIAPFIGKYQEALVATTSAPYISTAGYANYEEYIASRPKKMRQNQRRSDKYLSKEGRISGSGDDPTLSVEQALGQCLRFKEQWLHANGLSGKEIMQPAARTFLHEVFSVYQRAATGPRLAISSLYLDEQPISVGIGMRLGGHHVEYLAGFDHQYERHGPGRLRMAYGIEDCIEHDLSRYDMLTPETSFKRIWTESLPLVAQYMIATSLAGRVYRELYVRRVRPGLKRIYNALPTAVRRVVH